MATSVIEEIQQDPLVMSVAHALSLANEAAVTHGTNPADSLVTISEQPGTADRIWRIHYGKRDYINRRGGDLIIIVSERAGAVERVIRGQ